MKISARNVLKGKVKSIVKGSVNAEVTIQVARGINLVAMISLASVDSMGLEKGKDAYAVVKATSVMVGVDD